MECLICAQVHLEDLIYDQNLSPIICKILDIPEPELPFNSMSGISICYDCHFKINQVHTLYEELDDILFKISSIKKEIVQIVIRSSTSQSSRVNNENENSLRNKILQEIWSRTPENSEIEQVEMMMDHLADIKIEIEDHQNLTITECDKISETQESGNISGTKEIEEESTKVPVSAPNYILKEVKIVIEPLVVPLNCKISNEQTRNFLKRNHIQMTEISEISKQVKSTAGLPQTLSEKEINDRNVDTDTNNLKKRLRKKQFDKLPNKKTKFVESNEIDQVQRKIKMKGKREIKKFKKRDKDKTKEGEANYNCTKCEKQFKRQSYLEDHVSRVHLKIPNFFCPTCNRGYTTQFLLKEHLRRSHVEDSFKKRCPKCPKLFSQKLRLREHYMMNHTNERPFACSKCPKGFVTKRRLQRHEILHTGILDYCCHFCGLSYAVDEILKVHIKERHSDRVCKRRLTKRKFRIHPACLNSSEIPKHTENRIDSEIKSENLKKQKYLLDLEKVTALEDMNVDLVIEAVASNLI